MKPVLALCMALTLCACNTHPLAPPNTQLGLLQGDTTLDAAYNVAIQAYIQNAATLPAASKAKVKALIPQAYAAVQAVDNAQKLGSSTDLTGQIAAAQGLVTQLLAAAKGN